MDRRGVEMSLNLIILIVIGLVVLAIVIYLLTSNSGKWNRDVGACQAKGGTCKSQCDPGESGSTFFTQGCPNQDDICCMPESALLKG